MQNILTLKVATLRDIVVGQKECRGIGCKHLLDFCWRPHKELALFALAIGVLR